MLFAPENMLVLDSVDSTNNYAMALIQKGERRAIKPVFSMEQTRGKGRRGKHWESTKGANIMLSIPMKIQWLPVSQQFQLSVAVALSCYDLFSKYLFSNVFIKWPNDIFINDRKAGGILIENVIRGNLWQWAVIGIGLNINQENFETDALKAISLKQVTGQHYDVIVLVRELHEIVLKRLQVLRSGKSGKLLSEYNQNLFSRNRTVKLKEGNMLFETEIRSVSASGDLITKDVIERNFAFDEVQWMDL